MLPDPDSDLSEGFAISACRPSKRPDPAPFHHQRWSHPSSETEALAEQQKWRNLAEESRARVKAERAAAQEADWTACEPSGRVFTKKDDPRSGRAPRNPWKRAWRPGDEIGTRPAAIRTRRV
jgi:hypothetical protein